jgi:hypothetical protein
MIHEWCAEAGKWWDMHVVAPGSARAFAFPNATVHTNIAAGESYDFIRALAPEVVVHHGPQFDYGRVVPPSGALFWAIHGEYVLNAPRPGWGEPRGIFSNYQPKRCHTSWPQLATAPLGVDLSSFTPAKIAPPGPLTVGIIGRLSQEEIPLSFVRALGRWSPGPWRVRLIGGGESPDWAAKVRTALAGLRFVEFAGETSPEQMPAEYRRLHAVLVPSATETGSYVVAEAMASGLPIVARAVGGVPETAADGAILRHTDSELLRALRRLDGAAERQKWGRLARETAARRNSLALNVRARHAACAAALPPSVSMVVPVRDTPAEFLKDMWESVCGQTLPLWELILVDDNSSAPETIAELSRIAADPRVRLIRLAERGGISRALNCGIEAARSEVIARMDGDDAMTPDRLERQLAYLLAHPGVDVVGAQLIHWVGARTFNASAHPRVITPRVARESWWFLNHPTVMMWKAAWRRGGRYDETLPRAEDLDLWLKMVKNGVTIHNLPDVLLRYRMHPSQVTKGGDVGPMVRRIRARHKM